MLYSLVLLAKSPKSAVLISSQIKIHEHHQFFPSSPSFLLQISHFLYNNIAYPLHTSSVTSIFICCAWLSRLMRIALLFDSLLENISRERSTDGPIWKCWQLTGDPPLRFLNTETIPASHLHNQTNCVDHAFCLGVLIHSDCNSQTSRLSAFTRWWWYWCCFVLGGILNLPRVLMKIYQPGLWVLIINK